ncbi:hypothetical protein ACFIJ5_18565 (plasmid) [Haloimpatiens sp. FM7330]|uniref:hypothetical protein n=1 Tax=Haloimpatiens sp. FM7330 TaxID=3298610 RepID=UPI003643D8C2
MVVEYFSLLRVLIFKEELRIARLLKRIIPTIKKLGIKSKEKGKKSILQILGFTKLKTGQLEILAI